MRTRMSSMSRGASRALALALLAVTTVITIGMTSAPAQAMPNEWYRCWISGHGWMWCMDV
ncbi:hypothetical protein ETD86_54325 [Nonomuraea turkmeniaca]|uniref:Uncharacterized protein n=1 Tax=Nonomuraea turkmeniaca TaxID=103838 RepID=A0A5S4ETZ5_9ACTN|nr:hypothetical protein [Nonomuraea turkmeniaca]TMR01913.1 hypothetical protein ETD86_54325 [Nonomuraea turkmeniaca]